jgi:hypothetical protein
MEIIHWRHPQGQSHVEHSVHEVQPTFLRAVEMTYAKVKLHVCLIKHHDIKTYREVEVQLHEFLTTALDGD